MLSIVFNLYMYINMYFKLSAHSEFFSELAEQQGLLPALIKVYLKGQHPHATALC